MKTEITQKQEYEIHIGEVLDINIIPKPKQIILISSRNIVSNQIINQ